MHELAVCQALIEQVERVAADNNARAVNEIVVQLGPLAGIEQELLAQAYTVARAGTVAQHAQLIIEVAPLRIQCPECGQESEVSLDSLICPVCRNWRTTVSSGEDLILARLELEGPTRVH